MFYNDYFYVMFQFDENVYIEVIYVYIGQVLELITKVDVKFVTYVLIF